MSKWAHQPSILNHMLVKFEQLENRKSLSFSTKKKGIFLSIFDKTLGPSETTIKRCYSIIKTSISGSYNSKKFVSLTSNMADSNRILERACTLKREEFMHASKAILNLPTSSLHLCSPFQQNHKVKIHHQFTSFPKQLGQDSPPRK